MTDKPRKGSRGFIYGLAMGAVFFCPIGFAGGIYVLPILIAEDGLDQTQLSELSQSVVRRGVFKRDLPGSDAFHWGEGTVMINEQQIWLDGAISTGPDYRLYLVPRFVDTEESFKAIKAQAVHIGRIKTFENFAVPLPAGVNGADYAAVVVWCERFNEFITAASLEN